MPGLRKLGYACNSGHPKYETEKYEKGNRNRTDKTEVIIKGFKHKFLLYFK
jgi:hypothetical protein